MGTKIIRKGRPLDGLPLWLPTFISSGGCSLPWQLGGYFFLFAFPLSLSFFIYLFYFYFWFAVLWFFFLVVGEGVGGRGIVFGDSKRWYEIENKPLAGYNVSVVNLNTERLFQSQENCLCSQLRRDRSQNLTKMIQVGYHINICHPKRK